MVTKVFMEALSPTMEEGKVLTWHKKEGDAVFNGDVLAEVETDKAVMELSARAAGVLRKVLAPEGSTVQVGSVVAVIAEADEEIDAVVADTRDAPERPTAATRRAVPTVETATPTQTATAPASESSARVKASPLARRLAAERGIVLAGVPGSGPGGRVIRRDVEAAGTGAIRPLVDEKAAYHDVELSQLRKTIAKRLVQSIAPIPHFFLTAEVDMERTADARAALNALDAASKISYNDVILRVVAAALEHHPECNAWWQDDRIRYFNDVHLGMAVAVDDGLITPVLRHANRRSLREIASEALALAERARDRKLLPEEYTGATFSVSNLGMYDIDQFTAVINPPEAGVLAVGSIVDKPVAIDGKVQPRKRMRITMSCDHRVIDGATGARFLQTVKRMLENPLAIVW